MIEAIVFRVAFGQAARFRASMSDVLGLDQESEPRCFDFNYFDEEVNFE